MNLIAETIDGVQYPTLTDLSPTNLRKLVSHHAGEYSPELTRTQTTTLAHIETSQIISVDLTDWNMGV